VNVDADGFKRRKLKTGRCDGRAALRRTADRRHDDWWTTTVHAYAQFRLSQRSGNQMERTRLGRDCSRRHATSRPARRRLVSGRWSSVECWRTCCWPSERWAAQYGWDSVGCSIERTVEQKRARHVDHKTAADQWWQIGNGCQWWWVFPRGYGMPTTSLRRVVVDDGSVRRPDNHDGAVITVKLCQLIS